MQVRPNRTTVEGLAEGVAVAADGVGAEVVIRVDRNLSVAADDFIRPAVGGRLTVFTGDPKLCVAGTGYRFRLRLNAGPSGQRVVVEAADPLPK